MKRKAYVEDVSRLLSEATARTGEANEDDAGNVRSWLESLVSELQELTPPGELAEFHDDLVDSLRAPGGDEVQRHHATPPLRRWEQVMVRLYTLCKEEGVSFPIPRPSGQEGTGARPAWEGRLRNALAERGDPDPGEVIDHLRSLGNGEDA